MTMNLTKNLTEISNKIETDFGTLNSEQLNRKSHPNSWSIAQCLEHLIISNEKYFPVFENIIASKHKMTFWEKNNPLTSYTGKQMIKTLGPIVTKKFQSPKLFLPSQSTIRNSIVLDFVLHQEKLKKIVDALNDSKFDKIIITSPVAALLTLNLRDALQILVVHEERHLLQMVSGK